MRPVFADPKTDFVFKRIFGVRPSGSELDAGREAALEAVAVPELEALQEPLLRDRSRS